MPQFRIREASEMLGVNDDRSAGRLAVAVAVASTVIIETPGGSS